ncbi:hypothetical protein NDN08_003385 [Rhodosorus marinus]|uniref:DUF885 domain-containing protein n=2 Tax=Rhodosorus marinus TaxID=101924 RepID=A0AAV8UZ67_9RHOD|nr:hypothetical protein NDN08_003385 [Rhodosorus marinus]
MFGIFSQDGKDKDSDPSNMQIMPYHQTEAPVVPLHVVVAFSASVGAVRFILKRFRRGPSEEIDRPLNASGAIDQVWRIYAEVWDESCRWDPISATLSGDERNNHLLMDLRADARRNHLKKLQELDRKVDTVNFKDIKDDEEQTNYLFLKEYLRLEIKAMESFDIYEFPSHHLFGQHLMIAQLPSINALRHGGDCRSFVHRLRAFDEQVNQMIEAFRDGMKSKRTLHLNAVQSMIQQCQEQIVDDPETSVIYLMANARFRAVGGNVESLRKAIGECLIPAFRRLAKFLTEEYVLEARKEPGVWSLPDGENFYKGCLEYFTSLDITPDDVHALGLSEVQRISEKMRKVRKLLKDDLASSNFEFVRILMENPENFFNSSGEVLDRYQEILEIADEKLSIFFSKTPVATLTVKPIDELQAQYSPPAHYHPAVRAEEQPAIFFANCSRPETRPKYQMEAIALHEGVPGHHMQLGIAQEKPGLPRLRRSETSCCLSFVQGWALYAEHLGEVMNFYEDQKNYFGRLLTEMWRAVRLVVDTGIHYKRWTRDEAFQYLRNNACLTDNEIAAELDRIITMPGQAVAFKVGELRLLELKKFAERKLETDFNYKEFHDVVLRNGTLPLSVVDRNVTKWVATHRRNLEKPPATGADLFQDQLSQSRRPFINRLPKGSYRP